MIHLKEPIARRVISGDLSKPAKLVSDTFTFKVIRTIRIIPNSVRKMVRFDFESFLENLGWWVFFLKFVLLKTFYDLFQSRFYFY